MLERINQVFCKCGPRRESCLPDLFACGQAARQGRAGRRGIRAGGQFSHRPAIGHQLPDRGGGAVLAGRAISAPQPRREGEPTSSPSGAMKRLTVWPQGDALPSRVLPIGRDAFFARSMPTVVIFIWPFIRAPWIGPEFNRGAFVSVRFCRATNPENPFISARPKGGAQ